MLPLPGYPHQASTGRPFFLTADDLASVLEYAVAFPVGLGVLLLCFDVAVAYLNRVELIGPIIRHRISAVPSVTSRYQRPFFLTSGAANGHPTLPTDSVIVFGSV